MVLLNRHIFLFLNRFQFIVTVPRGISVKMFTAPADDVNIGDMVEVPEMIIWCTMVIGDPVVNCVMIRKIDTKTEPFSASGGKNQERKEELSPAFHRQYKPHFSVLDLQRSPIPP